MAEHTIEAHFTAASLASVGQSDLSERDGRIINAMAAAIGGGNAEHPMVIFEAAKIFCAVQAMRAAEAMETN